MNNQPPVATEDRHIRTGRFFARIYRYRRLLLRRWWVLMMCIGMVLGCETAYLHYSPPVFVSVGQMIVSLKLRTWLIVWEPRPP
jgi:hypothetical protein